MRLHCVGVKTKSFVRKVIIVIVTIVIFIFH